MITRHCVLRLIYFFKHMISLGGSKCKDISNNLTKKDTNMSIGAL